jgi:hypothetical protein
MAVCSFSSHESASEAFPQGAKKPVVASTLKQQWFGDIRLWCTTMDAPLTGTSFCSNVSEDLGVRPAKSYALAQEACRRIENPLT